MPRFFIQNPAESIKGDILTITGEDSVHISRSLRMKCGEELVACDFSGLQYRCEICGFEDGGVQLKILEKKLCDSEPDIRVRIFQALPKGDKLDTVVQKCTELGAYDFTPVLTSRCISRPDEKSAAKKCGRWQKISAEAAKQCGRGIIPAVNKMCSFEKALSEMASSTLALMCYECEDGYSIKRCIEENREKLASGAEISVFIGSEGGISPEEAQTARDMGIICVGLGKRILRTETAPLFAVSAIMLLTGNAE